MAIVNQKGGVGKTTTAVNLAAGLAMFGCSTLLVDADPQGNASSGVGVFPSRNSITLFEILTEGAPVDEAVCTTAIENLYLIPSSINLAGFELLTASWTARESILKDSFCDVGADYQWIILDTPPALGMLTLNCLTAAHGLILPLQCEYYALEGLTQLLRTVDLVRQHLNPALDIWKVLMTMRDSRTRLAEQVEEEIKKFFGSKVARSVIPRNVRISESPSFGQPVLTYDPRSKGAIAYFQFAKEVYEYGTSRAW